MKRCIIIYNPDFDDHGNEGIQAAMGVAGQLQAGFKEIIRMATEDGIGSDGANITDAEAEETKRHLSQMVVKVKKIEL